MRAIRCRASRSGGNAGGGGRGRVGAPSAIGDAQAERLLGVFLPQLTPRGLDKAPCSGAIDNVKTRLMARQHEHASKSTPRTMRPSPRAAALAAAHANCSDASSSCASLATNASESGGGGVGRSHHRAPPASPRQAEILRGQRQERANRIVYYEEHDYKMVLEEQRLSKEIAEKARQLALVEDSFAARREEAEQQELQMLEGDRAKGGGGGGGGGGGEEGPGETGCDCCGRGCPEDAAARDRHPEGAAEAARRAAAAATSTEERHGALNTYNQRLMGVIDEMRLHRVEHVRALAACDAKEKKIAQDLRTLQGYAENELNTRDRLIRQRRRHEDEAAVEARQVGLVFEQLRRELERLDEEALKIEQLEADAQEKSRRDEFKGLRRTRLLAERREVQYGFMRSQNAGWHEQLGKVTSVADVKQPAGAQLSDSAWASMAAGLLVVAYETSEQRIGSLHHHLELLHAEATQLEEGLASLTAECAALEAKAQPGGGSHDGPPSAEAVQGRPPRRRRGPAFAHVTSKEALAASRCR